MKDILIEGQIGADFFTDGVTAEKVRSALAEVQTGEDVRLTVNSPGGDVWEGVAIFNVIRDFARTRPECNITTYIQGTAASIASVIALAACSVSEKNKVIAEDNAVFMVHDCWDIVLGNRNDLREKADFMERIDDLMADVYVRKTGKTAAEMKKTMDAESWFYGKEILDAGFADEIISDKKDGAENPEKTESEKAELRNSFIARAQAEIVATQKAMERNADKADTNARLAAMAVFGKEKAGGKPDNNTSEKGGKVEGCMTAEELKKSNPEVYKAIAQEGEKAGAAKEQARTSRLLAMGEKAGAVDFALDCIKSGKSPSDEAVIDAFMDKGAAARVLKAQEKDEKKIPDVVAPKDSAGRDNDAVMAAFDKEFGGK